MDRPRRVPSALKLAGPPPQSRIFRARSRWDRSNIEQYSSNDLPHGTTAPSVNISLQSEQPRRISFGHGVEVLLRKSFRAHRQQKVREAVRRHRVTFLPKV